MARNFWEHILYNNEIYFSLNSWNTSASMKYRAQKLCNLVFLLLPNLSLIRKLNEKSIRFCDVFTSRIHKIFYYDFDIVLSIKWWKTEPIILNKELNVVRPCVHTKKNSVERKRSEMSLNSYNFLHTKDNIKSCMITFYNEVPLS